VVEPQLPSHWTAARVTRKFRGAMLQVTLRRDARVSDIVLLLDGEAAPGNRLTGIKPGQTYTLEVRMPSSSPS